MKNNSLRRLVVPISATEDDDADDPLEVKPRLGEVLRFKEEPHYSTCSVQQLKMVMYVDDPLDLKPLNEVLGVKEEQPDSIIASPSTTEECLPEIKPQFKVVVEEGPGDYACLGQDGPDVHVRRSHSYIGRNGRSSVRSLSAPLTTQLP